MKECERCGKDTSGGYGMVNVYLYMDSLANRKWICASCYDSLCRITKDWWWGEENFKELFDDLYAAWRKKKAKVDF